MVILKIFGWMKANKIVLDRIKGRKINLKKDKDLSFLDPDWFKYSPKLLNNVEFDKSIHIKNGYVIGETYQWINENGQREKGKLISFNSNKLRLEKISV